MYARQLGNIDSGLFYVDRGINLAKKFDQKEIKYKGYLYKAFILTTVNRDSAAFLYNKIAMEAGKEGFKSIQLISLYNAGKNYDIMRNYDKMMEKLNRQNHWQ